MTHLLQSLETRIPPLLLTILFADFMLALSELNTLPMGRNAFTSGLAIFCLCSSLAFTGLSLLAFYRANTTLDPHHPERSTQLVQKGIYRITRNPIYVAFLLVLLAWGLLLAEGLALASVPLFIMYMNRFQIAPEESALAAHFGSDYLRYCRQVNRWLSPVRKMP